MTPRELELGRMGRSALLLEIARLEERYRDLERHLTDVQERCTELLLENRKLRGIE